MSPEHGAAAAGATSVASAIVAWLPLFETFLRISATSVAIVSGIYAIRYYREKLKNKRDL